MISQATQADAAEILELQKLAYVREQALYPECVIEPMVQPLAEVESQFADHVFLKVLDKGKIIAAIRGKLADSTCHIGKLMVHPAYERRGIGRKLLSAMEDYFPAAVRAELFTGSRSEGNIKFYEKIGYQQCGSKKVDETVTLVRLEKHRKE